MLTHLTEKPFSKLHHYLNEMQIEINLLICSRYDDSTVTLVSDAQVLKPKPPKMPYLLMYRRQDTLPVPHRSTPKTE